MSLDFNWMHVVVFFDTDKINPNKSDTDQCHKWQHQPWPFDGVRGQPELRPDRGTTE